MARNDDSQTNVNSVSVSYQNSIFIKIAALAYHKHEAEFESIGTSEDFKLGYIVGCSDTLKDELKWEELDMNNNETFELLQSMNAKLDKLGDKINDIDVRLARVETECKLTWRSKQLWIPIACSIIVAVLGAIFRGEIHF